jgi:hypothetical protein
MVKKLKCKKDGKMHEVWRSCAKKGCLFLQAGINMREWYQLNKSLSWDFIKYDLKPILFKCVWKKEKKDIVLRFHKTRGWRAK